MASGTSLPSLAERVDVHKSCKSLETLLNVLNDYCEAAGAIVILQKKLAKALRDTAGMKTTREIAANAMNASATIFETSSDINSKFAKTVDKEYDSISTEVKKWFKKLAKEEKAHDERMSNANVRIKQAGQLYERKSKKNPHDATEEHARYINLISSLGPEISQEKYNHAMTVTQRHTATTYSAAACLSRIADAAWLKTCEGVRRFSPTIGQLGEWRALCEGGWTGPVPQDLPDIDENQLPQPDHEPAIERRSQDDAQQAPTTLRNIENRNSYESTDQSRPPPSTTESDPSRHHLPSIQNSPTIPHVNHPNISNVEERHLSTGPSSFEPPRPFSDKNNTDSVRSLSAFPLPPTHFPIPPPHQQPHSQPSQPLTTRSSTYAMPRLTESPLPDINNGGEDPSLTLAPTHREVSPTSIAPPVEQALHEQSTMGESNSIVSPSSDADETRQLVPVSSHTLPLKGQDYTHPREMPTANSQPFAPYSDFQNEREFGVNAGHISKARTMDAVRSSVERRDTAGSNGSVVATMRSRYSNISGTTSPGPKEIPRLPHSVNDLASRYQHTTGPSSPRLRPSSNPISHQLTLSPIDTGVQSQRQDSHEDRVLPSAQNVTSWREEDVIRRRQQRTSDLVQLELKEKELQLRERERDIEIRVRELEQDRARLAGVQEGDEYVDTRTRALHSVIPQPQLKPRERKTSFRSQRPQSQLDSTAVSPSGSNSNAGRPHSQYSHSTSHLVPPSPSTQASHSYDGQSSYYSHSPTSSHQSTQSPHAPYCGCETCSASKYKSPISSQTSDLRPPAKPMTLRPPEKSKPGWMRRLSMPVGNAFHLDSKKGISNATGVGNGGQGRSRIFSMDGKKNISTTMLQDGVKEDGRRSYEVGGISNRSMTNLGMGKR